MRLIDGDALCVKIEDNLVSLSTCISVDWYRGKSQMKKAVLEDIKNAPTIKAIPVEWLENRRETLMLAAMVHSNVYGDNSVELCHAVNVVLDMWQKEQEAQND